MEHGGKRFGIAAATLLLSMLGCFSYSSYQDARIVPKGESQATLSVSASSYADRYSDERTYWYPIEMSPRFHLSKRFDAGLRFSFLMVPGESEDGGNDISGIVVVGADVRGAVISNCLVLSLPVAFTVGAETFSTLQVQPGAIVTIPVFDQLDLSGSARLYLYTGDLWDSSIDDMNAWGYTAGFGWHVSKRVTLRPEVAWLVFPGDELTYTQYGLGLTIRGNVASDQELGKP